MSVIHWSDHIETNPEVLGGKPVIKGTRLSVPFILGLLARGMSENDILTEYPRLSVEDIRACLEYAAQALENARYYHLTENA